MAERRIAPPARIVRLALAALAGLAALLTTLAPRLVEPWYKWIPQPLQDRLWRATPIVASVLLLSAIIVGIMAARDPGAAPDVPDE